MWIHIVDSTKGTETDSPYNKIVEVVRAKGHDIAGRRSASTDASKDWPSFYAQTKKDLKKADLVVVEASDLDYTQGFFTSQALKSKKPTLVLFKGDLNDTPLASINDPLLTICTYSDHDTLEDGLSAFLQKNMITTKDLRFNFFIDRQIYSYLRQTSYETGRNKSEIIRQAIEEEIDKREA